ncbi:MAG: hypothetical protein HSCHL_1388 [Hydrogenibacillus schlegelii]|uniref:MrfA-like Zn-binding domain-containing protein n=1 Tax=Hydrogenibacillus schlegelii TaxID=1484 RepID=A0A2T5G4Q6_HYDSH|nr:DrmB family protein [Hydrogenibacillus schlegelii]PTQ51171.1 MAG: hypothetical protein HSCHL_1388 [Hydrogenibacillus schlegelii]
MPHYQELRLSQLILQYGPGAILETTEGPRLIPLPEHGLFGTHFDPESFSLDLPQLEKILGEKRVFRIPTGSDLQEQNAVRVSWRTRPFPEWKLCVDHGILYRRVCPKCGTGTTDTGGREAIRFVTACPRGHLDEVNWFAAVHGGSECRGTRGDDPYYLEWITRGGALSETIIRCPGCGKEKTLAEIYRMPHRCSGRYPEREPLGRGSEPQRDGCSEKAYVIQRQSSALRIPETVTVLMVPPYATEIQLALSRSRGKGGLNLASLLIAHLNSAGLWDKENKKITGDEEKIYMNLKSWLDLIESMEESRRALKEYERKILKARLETDPSLLLEQIRDILEFRPEDSMENLLRHEFRVLREGSRTGIPSRPDLNKDGMLLEIRRDEVVKICAPGGKMEFLVAPVRKLHAVTVQTGYRRAVGPFDPDTESGLPGEPVGVDSVWNDERWLPGYESTGEGIFITSGDPGGWHFPLEGSSAKRWLERWKKGSTYGGSPSGSKIPVSPHPVFYWWHTLSHLLLHALSVESGYSLASIRERVYVEVEEQDKARGGVLLYTTGRGVSGSMGGLIALVPVFEHFLRTAFENAFHCSADPLCAETVTEHSGAACFACALVPETSCENRNMWLDRNIIIENMPWSPAGEPKVCK